MCGEKHQELESPVRFLPGRCTMGRHTDIEPRKGKPGHGGRPEPKPQRQPMQVSEAEQNGGELRTGRESDPLIVLRDGSADHEGKRRTGIRSVHRKPGPDCRTGYARLTPLQGIAKPVHSEHPSGAGNGWRRKRVSLRSPVRENRTPGSVRGPSGNGRSYRDGAQCHLILSNSPLTGKEHGRARPPQRFAAWHFHAQL